jgi:branched-chain amino acid transport system permease protein
MKNKSNFSEQSSPAKSSSGLLKSLMMSQYIRKHINIIIGALLVVVFGTIPLYINVDTSYFAYYLFICFVYIALSQGWNLVAGYTGQISLGGHAFFALGAYTTAIIWLHDLTKTWYYFDPVVMILSGLVPVIFAIIIGTPLLSRLRGDYFSFGTLAAAEVLRIVILKGGSFTQGAMGLRLPASSFSSMSPYYWTGFLLAIFATATVYLITRSRIGLALRALNEDEMSAASHGVHILFYKIFAFAVSAFLAGVCGSLFAYYLFIVSPLGIMNLNWMFYPILICVLGGNGTILGPIIGAFVVGAIFSYGDVFVGQIHPMLTGLLIILVMKFMPTGIMGLKDKIFTRR